jgi:bifunctional non-homologous end joining protein LigD
MLRDLLKELNLQSFPKASGSKGLQVYVPFNSAVTYELTQPLARALAEVLEEREPKLIVSKMPKVFRTRKVFIDWSQNAELKTTVGVYSLRAKIHRPYTSMPVEWDELSAALKQAKKEWLYFKPEEALAPLEKQGDLFKPILSLVQKAPREILRHLKNQSPRTAPVNAEALEPYR